jgi:membrane AbrB-like protein
VTVACALLYAVAALGLWAAGAPSPPLFAALLAAAYFALRSPAPKPVPGGVRALGMAVVGTAAGAHIDGDVIHTVAAQPVAVIGGVLATLVVSMLAGQVLRLDPDVDARTAAFASVAGGASGVALAAREYGADDGVVMSVQYLRVVLVLVSVPVVAPLLGGVQAATVPEPGAPVSEHLFTLAAMVLGLGLARLLPFAAAPVLWTLVVSAVLALSGLFDHPDVPTWVLAAGYTVVGANVGSSFTRDRLRRLVRLFPLAVVQVLLGVGACAVIGVVFARAVGVSLLDGYLATTPGGLPAVVAVAVDSGNAIGLILTMQFVRVFLALACAPLIGWVLRRSGPDLGDRPL